MSSIGKALGKPARTEPPDGARDPPKTDQNRPRGNEAPLQRAPVGYERPAVKGAASRPDWLQKQASTASTPAQQLGAASSRPGSSTSVAPVRSASLLSPLQGLGPKPKPLEIKQWCKEIKVGTWQSGEGTVSFELDLFSWITAREVPEGIGFCTIKLKTSSISSAIFDKRSNVLKIRGVVEVPLDALNRWYDPFSNVGTQLFSRCTPCARQHSSFAHVALLPFGCSLAKGLPLPRLQDVSQLSRGAQGDPAAQGEDRLPERQARWQQRFVRWSKQRARRRRSCASLRCCPVR